MTDEVFKRVLARLYSAEIELELANALTPEDERLNEAEIVLHGCILQIEKVARYELHRPQ